MIDSINYTLPGTTTEQRAGFQALKSLLTSSGRADDNTSFSLSTAPDLKPVTQLRLSPVARGARISLNMGRLFEELPGSLFSSDLTPVAAMTLADIETRLAGKIIRVDHTGIVAQGGKRPRKDWINAANMLAENAALYEYPKSPEYDPKSASWLFVVPCTEQEFASGITEPRLRQPKFELVFDMRAGPFPVWQVDVATGLTRKEAQKLFPDGEGYELPGLGEVFRSVNVTSPWAGIRMRFDLRYKSEPEINEWSSASRLIEAGERRQHFTYH